VIVKTTALVRVVAAGALSVVTLAAIDRIGEPGLRDGLAMPGAVIGMLGGQVGLYDTPSRAWATLCIAGNFVFYATFWWVILQVIARVYARAKGS
jgi:hypothetical protein